MPKTKKRQQINRRGGGGVEMGGDPRGRPSRPEARGANTSPAPARVNRRAPASRAPSPTSFFFPALVALGCWGMAISFFFFYTDPNHYLYGGMAVAMALIWSFSVGLRIRRYMRLGVRQP